MTLLSSVVTKPDTLVGELEILSDAQRQWLLTGLNDTKTEFPNLTTVHKLFEEQVKTHAGPHRRSVRRATANLRRVKCACR